MIERLVIGLQRREELRVARLELGGPLLEELRTEIEDDVRGPDGEGVAEVEQAVARPPEVDE